jgi:4-hydroxy-3-polyprenylbenzoate decarboxylase
MPSRLIVGITGATGSIYGIRLLEALQGTEIETHVIISKWGALTMAQETSYTAEQVQRLATRSYAAADQGAAISSGSFLTSGMVVAPCSMRTLAAIAHGQSEHLVHRAADVVLKERRPLVLLVRETPLNAIHLENMLQLARMGVVIFPPVPAFYHRPSSIDELVDQTVMRVLDQFGIHRDLSRRWDGMR